VPTVLAVPSTHYAQIKGSWPQSIHYLPINYDDAWARDIAPVWLSNEIGFHAVTWQFNAWHGLYREVSHDQRFADELARQAGVPITSSSVIIEPGNLTSDGAGVVAAVWSSIARNNPQCTKYQLENHLCERLGCQRVYWLEAGLIGDETGGHIDNVVQFIGPETVLIHRPNSTTPTAQYGILQTIYEQVLAWRSIAGKPYQLVEVPAPATRYLSVAEASTIQRRTGSIVRDQHYPLLASYVNAVRLAHALLVPQFGLASDALAVSSLKQQLPELQIVAIDARELIAGGGGLHCITHHLPESVWQGFAPTLSALD